MMEQKTFLSPIHIYRFPEGTVEVTHNTSPCSELMKYDANKWAAENGAAPKRPRSVHNRPECNVKAGDGMRKFNIHKGIAEEERSDMLGRISEMQQTLSHLEPDEIHKAEELKRKIWLLENAYWLELDIYHMTFFN